MLDVRSMEGLGLGNEAQVLACMIERLPDELIGDDDQRSLN